MRVVAGDIAAKAREGLKPTLAAQGHFLACSCYPEQDNELVLPKAGSARPQAKVASVEYLSADIRGIRPKHCRPSNCKAGQFTSLFIDETTARCYSLASVPAGDKELFLNIGKVPSGLASGWVFDNVKADGRDHFRGNGRLLLRARQCHADHTFRRDGFWPRPETGSCATHSLTAIKAGSSLTTGTVRRNLLSDRATKETRAAISQLRVRTMHFRRGCAGRMRKGHSWTLRWPTTPTLLAGVSNLCGNRDTVTAAKQQAFFAGAPLRDSYSDPFWAARVRYTRAKMWFGAQTATVSPSRFSA
jgi:hypothetical protein